MARNFVENWTAPQGPRSGAARAAARWPPQRAGPVPGTPIAPVLPMVRPPTRPRLREQALQEGPERLADVDLLALVIGTGTPYESAVAVAAKLLDGAGGLSELARRGGHALSTDRGIGSAKAARILAALELGRRSTERALSESRATMASFEAVVAWARPRIAHLEHEEVWLLGLDGRNGLRSAARIAQGGLHGTALTPSDVLRPAVRSGASAIILLHNHPSGDPTPSADDLRMTAALEQACRVVGVPLLDHVVVARGGASSLAEHRGSP
jgi:DNA repair protein RadC